MSRAGAEGLVDQTGNFHTAINAADLTDRAEIYRRLNVRLTYQPEDQRIRSETTLHPGA